MNEKFYIKQKKIFQVKVKKKIIFEKIEFDRIG